jgi:hypothetical protein
VSEIIYCIIILALIGANLFTIYYYQRQVQVLIDRATSRSYPEYVQTKILEQANSFPKVSTQETPKVDDDSVLAELNSLF